MLALAALVRVSRKSTSRLALGVFHVHSGPTWPASTALPHTDT